MKMRDPHITRLSQQAIVVLTQLREINGQQRFVFYSVQGAEPYIEQHDAVCPVSDGLRVPHDRARLPQPCRDVVERQMAHAECNQVTAAYVNSGYLPEHRKMMQHWADYLDELKAGAKMLHITSTDGWLRYPCDH